MTEEEIEKKEEEEKATEERAEEEVKEIEKIEEVEVTTEEVKPVLEKEWTPRTSLGKAVLKGEITDINKILEEGLKIKEPEIVDLLVPNLKSELILIGGRPGKGGGIQRTPVRITAKMHESGRRYTCTAFAVVGNEDGLVGIGKGRGKESRHAIEKAIRNAKLNLIKVPRGCGSWECGCGEPHSIPFKTKGKSGSVRVVLMPAPKGVGLVADDESKKILRLAGIKDVWAKTFGNTGMRINLARAVYNALKNLNKYKLPE